MREKWPEIRSRIKEQYPHISDSDLVYQIGQEVELLHRLQEKLGKNNNEIKEWLSLMG